MTSGPGSDAGADTPPVRRGRGRPRDPETDQRITAAAAQLMLERGFDRTTVDDVASLARVGKATVYRRWPSKDDLAVAAMETLYNTEMPEPDTGAVASDLLEGYRSVLEFVNTPGGAAFLRTSVMESVRDERIAALYRSSSERREATALATLEKAVRRGEVRADADLDLVVQWLGGVLAVRVITGRPLPTVQDAEKLVEFTLRGILADPSSGPGRD